MNKFKDEQTYLDFSDVLIVPKASTVLSRKDVSLETTYTFPHSPVVYTGIPIMAANMDTVGTFAVANVFKKYGMFTVLNKHYGVDKIQTRNFSYDHVSVSTGIGSSDLEQLDKIIEVCPEIKFITVDVANGYLTSLGVAVQTLRDKYPDKVIIAGNVVTAEGVYDLITKGADAVKSGIGGGSACSTRVKTGVGVPQLSAVLECSEAAKNAGGHLISDGGCTCPGDVAKAFAAGASFVMLGGMLAGHIETGNEFYGMSSQRAMNKYAGGVADHRTDEGRVLDLDIKGPLKNTVQDILGGLRSTCTYVGASNLTDLFKEAQFIKVNNQYNRYLVA